MAGREEVVDFIEFRVFSLLFLPHAQLLLVPVVVWEMSIRTIRVSPLTVVMGDIHHSMAPLAKLQVVKVVRDRNRTL
jgi:hypothetical protein